MDAASNVASVDRGKEERQVSCPTCQDLPFRDKTWTPFYVPDAEDKGRIWYTKVSSESLRISSQKGCPYCDLLYQVGKTVSRNVCTAKPELVSFKFGWWWTGDSNLSVEMNYEGSTIQEILHLYVTKGRSATT